FEGKDIDAIKGLVSAGLRVTLLPEITLVDSLPRSTIKIRIDEPKVTRTVGVIIPRDRDLLPTELLFYNFVHNFCDTLTGYQQEYLYYRCVYRDKATCRNIFSYMFSQFLWYAENLEITSGREGMSNEICVSR